MPGDVTDAIIICVFMICIVAGCLILGDLIDPFSLGDISEYRRGYKVGYESAKIEIQLEKLKEELKKLREEEKQKEIKCY